MYYCDKLQRRYVSKELGLDRDPSTMIKVYVPCARSSFLSSKCFNRMTFVIAAKGKISILVVLLLLSPGIT